MLLQSVLQWESRFSSLLPPLGTNAEPRAPIPIPRPPAPRRDSCTEGLGYQANLYQKGRSRGGWVDWGFGINRGMLLYIYKITRTYCRAQGTVLQYPVITYNGKESRKEIPLKLKQHAWNTVNQLLSPACPASCSVVASSATLWTGARQAPLSVALSRQEYWSGFPFPSPGDLSDPGIEPTSLESPLSHQGSLYFLLQFKEL